MKCYGDSGISQQSIMNAFRRALVAALFQHHSGKLTRSEIEWLVAQLRARELQTLVSAISNLPSYRPAEFAHTGARTERAVNLR